MNPTDKKKLKAQSHPLKPVIIVGQAGLSQAVLDEAELALDTHELIKVKIRAEREQRNQIRDRICSATGAELVQTIGQIAVIYRKNPNK